MTGTAKAGTAGQFPDGVDVGGPAVPELVAAVVLAEHGVGPLPQVGQPRVVGVGVQADPVRGSGPARGGGVERVGDGLGQVLEPAARSRSARRPAWSSRSFISRTWPRRSASCAARAARLSPRARGEGSTAGSAVTMLSRPARRASKSS